MSGKLNGEVCEEARRDADRCTASYFGPEWTRFPIARLRDTKTTGMWELYWRDRNLKFHRYDRLAPSLLVDDLLAEIERDPTMIFWG